MTTVSPVFTSVAYAAGSTPVFKTRPRFGNKPYADIFEGLSLTPSQADVLQIFAQLASAHTLDDFKQALPVLSHPDYTHLFEAKGRKPFHTPFADLFTRLEASDQQRMIDDLFKNLQKTPDTTSQQNTLDTLVDLYFYALRPTTDKNGGRPVAEHLLNRFDTLLADDSKPLALRRYAQQRLRNQLKILQNNYPVFPARLPLEELIAARNEVNPLLSRYLTPPPQRQVKKEAIAKLQQALLDPDPDVLQAMSTSGEIALVIPEWLRVTGPNNTQHSNQAYTLEGHLLSCVAKSKASPYYQTLSPHQKKLLTMAALLHDIGKRTGPANLKPVITPDRCHSLKSEDVAWANLPALGFSTKDTRTIARLLRYHTALGNTILRTRALGEAKPPEELLDYLANVTQSPVTLTMLQALTEGDVRSLSLDQKEFNGETATRLKDYGELIAQRIKSNWPMRAQVLLQNIADTTHDWLGHLKKDWAGFRSL